jgi:hypothetical protein
MSFDTGTSVRDGYTHDTDLDDVPSIAALGAMLLASAVGILNVLL